MALPLVRTAGKVAIGVGAVYLTLDQGIWSTTTQQGSSALQNLRTSVLPATDKYIKQVPNTSQVSNTFINTWNSGVQKAFGGLASTPDLAKKYSKKAVDQVKQSLK